MTDDITADVVYHQQLPQSFWWTWLGQRGLTQEAIAEARLGFVAAPIGDHDKFAGCLAIPYYDGRRRLRGFRFRHPDGHRQKYDQPKGQRPMLYGPYLVQRPHIALTEGELDAVLLRQLGYDAIGVHGATAFRDEWGFLFRDCETVTLIYDGDDAGRSGAAKAARSISKRGPLVRSVEMPNGLDVTDLYLRDAGELHRLLA